jgi:UDP-N-acetylglucosamine 2-epimerase (non-hydrolysing)
MELARQEDHPSVYVSIDDSLSAAVGPDCVTRPFVLITGHRRENFGEGIEQICKAIRVLALGYPDYRFVYPVHLNPNVEQHAKRLLGDIPNVSLIPTHSYQNFVALMSRCRLILTDSGGVQEEAPSLGKPVLVMRATTERPEGVEFGTARLVGAQAQSIVHHTSRVLDDSAAYLAMASAVNPYGDGHAAERIVARIERFLGYTRGALSTRQGGWAKAHRVRHVSRAPKIRSPM